MLVMVYFKAYNKLFDFTPSAHPQIMRILHLSETSEIMFHFVGEVKAMGIGVETVKTMERLAIHESLYKHI